MVSCPANGDRVVAGWEVRNDLQPDWTCTEVCTARSSKGLASLGAALRLGGSSKWAVSTTTPTSSAVKTGAMTSTATPIHRGRSQQVWLAETVGNADGKLVARGQVRLHNMRGQRSETS